MAKVERYLSLGAGVQSSVLALLIERGQFGKPGEDAPALAVFADTGSEPPDVYEHLAWLESELTQIEVVKVGERNLFDDALNGLTGEKHQHVRGGGDLPVYALTSDGKGVLSPRQCTNRYKIHPLESYIRERFGQPRPGKLHIETWTGISLDEVFRVKDDKRKSWKRVFPLVDNKIRRSDCEAWFAREYPGRNLPRSACFFCPFRSSEDWVEIKTKHPKLFAQAERLDNAIRTQNLTSGISANFLHRRLLPLAEAVELDRKYIAAQDAQMTFPSQFMEECLGVCAI